jgi:hypothetical protein
MITNWIALEISILCIGSFEDYILYVTLCCLVDRYRTTVDLYILLQIVFPATSKIVCHGLRITLCLGQMLRWMGNDDFKKSRRKYSWANRYTIRVFVWKDWGKLQNSESWQAESWSIFEPITFLIQVQSGTAMLNYSVRPQLKHQQRVQNRNCGANNWQSLSLCINFRLP